MVPIREPKTYKILLADEQTLVREGLAAICNSQPFFTVSDQCSEGMAALRRIEEDRPDIAVLDLGLTDIHALEIVKRVKSANLPTRMIVISPRNDRKTILDALRTGVNGIVLKSAPASQMIEAFEQVLGGGIYIAPQVELNHLFASKDSRPRNPIDTLSTREHQVFQLMVEGNRAKEIAARLDLSPKTVDTYRASLMRKLDIHDVASLVKFAIQNSYNNA